MTHNIASNSEYDPLLTPESWEDFIAYWRDQGSTNTIQDRAMLLNLIRIPILELTTQYEQLNLTCRLMQLQLDETQRRLDMLEHEHALGRHNRVQIHSPFRNNPMMNGAP